MAYTTHLRPENRKGPDLLVKWVKISRYIAWILLGVCILFIDQAKPRTAGFFDRLFNVNVYAYWDLKLVTFAFVIAVVLFLFSFISILINVMRLKRKTDRLCVSLIISLISSSIYMLIYLSSFANA